MGLIFTRKINAAKTYGIPYGIRTRVAAVKGQCPRPLDERDRGNDQSPTVKFSPTQA